MKNLHLLYTDKPSRLHIAKNGDLHYSYENVLHLVSANDKPYSIYITSNEPPKDGDVCMVAENHLNTLNILFTSTEEITAQWKKIILTTDQELIADGVQAIDNEFLEWFVKNSSCDVVEVETYFKKIGVETDANGYREMDILAKHYRLSIPKEESIVKDLNYWKANAEEDYMRVPISVLRYISELENKMYSEDYMKKIAFAFYYDMSHKMGVPEDLINENFDNVGVWFKQFKNK